MTPLRDRRRDAGSALLLTLVATAALASAGMMLATVADTERAVAANFRAASELRYAADAIAEHVVADLSGGTPWSAFLAGSARSTLFDGTNTPITPLGEALDLVAMTAEVQAESDRAGWGLNAPRWRIVASGASVDLLGAPAPPAYVMAWIADDPAEADGDPQVDGNGVVLVHARARGAQGAQRDVFVTLGRGCESGMCDDDARVRVLAWRELS